MDHLQDGFDIESVEAARTSATSTGSDGVTRQPHPEAIPEHRNKPVMLRLVRPNPAPSTDVRSRCPDCLGELAVLRVIPGRARSEYWTLRCTACGGIHLDILKASPVPTERHPDAGTDGSPGA